MSLVEGLKSGFGCATNIVYNQNNLIIAQHSYSHHTALVAYVGGWLQLLKQQWLCYCAPNEFELNPIP